MYSSSFANNQISNLITPVSYFVNHIKQLARLKEDLSKYRQASIVGTSGIGKSQLARMYAYENKDRYTVIWFFDCNLDINQEFLNLAKRINENHNNAVIPENIMSARKDVMNHLADKTNWLLVFDNLKINDNKKVQDFINWEHNGNIIFCSQYAETLPNAIKMTAFSKNDTVNIVDQILEHENHEVSDFLMNEFNGYPILTVQGAQLLKEVKGLSMAGYKKKLNQSPDKIKCNVELAISNLSSSARDLIYKIALINNQSFSKEFLSLITADEEKLDDDIYQISKLMLILNTDTNEANPIFEMHDVIAARILEMNGDNNNKLYLENIITKLMQSIPASIYKARLLRNAKTLPENLQVMSENAEKYKVNAYKLMELNLHLLWNYSHGLDFYKAEKNIEWFNKNDQDGNYKLLLMNNHEKSIYAAYLGRIGGYFMRRFSDHNQALRYYKKAQEILDKVRAYESWKFNLYYLSVSSNIALGNISEAEEDIKKMQELHSTGLVDEVEAGLFYRINAKLLYCQGKYEDSLQEIEKDLLKLQDHKVGIGDTVTINSYLLKCELLNNLKNYEKAYDLVHQLYVPLRQSLKGEKHAIFARIFTQRARSELGQNKVNEALDHINKAIAIFLADEKRNPKNANFSEDPDLATAYVTGGDILFAMDKLNEAIESYRDAQAIYFHLYKDRSKNIAHVSYLYMQGAKAACKKKDSHHYKCFGRPQLEEFGLAHPNTTIMLDYCKQYNMDSGLLYEEDYTKST